MCGGAVMGKIRAHAYLINRDLSEIDVGYFMLGIAGAADGTAADGPQDISADPAYFTRHLVRAAEAGNLGFESGYTYAQSYARDQAVRTWFPAFQLSILPSEYVPPRDFEVCIRYVLDNGNYMIVRSSSSSPTNEYYNSSGTLLLRTGAFWSSRLYYDADGRFRTLMVTNLAGGLPTPESDWFIAEVVAFREGLQIPTSGQIYDMQLGTEARYKLAEFFSGIPVSEDPYSPGGTSGPATGDGTFDFSSDPVDFQAAPTIGAYDTGMVSMYVPSAGDLRGLASYLWAGPFDPQNFRKLVADPMDAIIGLSILPLTAAEIGTQSAELMVGNISTGLTMPLATRQYVVVDCGTVNVLPKWGAYLDFSPYSKLQLFLPYIGYVDVSPDDCMNGTISVRYTVDLLSGTCVVQVKCQDHVLYEFAGTCSCSCPVTAGQYQNVVTSALKLGSALASSVTSLGGMLGALDDVANTAVSAAKPAISRSGGFGGSSGLMGHQVPYLILTVPRMCTPGDQSAMMGYPSFVTETLGDLSGYCVVDTIHLSGIPGASTADLEEIDQLLKGGVYL